MFTPLFKGRWKTASACALTLIACLAIPQDSKATLIALWTFEDSQPTTAGPHVAEEGLRASDSEALGFHTATATVYSTPAGNGSPRSFSSNNWSEGDYYQFSTDTTGLADIQFGFDQTRSGTGPSSFRLEVDYDGMGMFTELLTYTVNQVTWSSMTFQPDSVFGPFALGPNADNNPNLTVRLTSLQTTTAAGTNRVDNVSFSVIPEPSGVGLGLLALLGMTVLRRR